MKKLLLVLTLLFGVINPLNAQKIKMDINDELKKETESFINLLVEQGWDLDAFLKSSDESMHPEQMFLKAIVHLYFNEEELFLSWLKKAYYKGSNGAVTFVREYGSKIGFEGDPQVESNVKLRTLNNELDKLKRGNPKEYFKRVYQLAGENNVNAMVRLGKLYDSGDGIVSKSTEEALSWYRKAIVIDEAFALENISVNGDASLQIIKEYVNKGNANAFMRLADYYNSSCRPYGGDVQNTETAKMAISNYKKAAQAGIAEAQTKINELTALIQKKEEKERQEAESRRLEQELYSSTMRNFAGFWTCSNSYTQYKFDSNGNGWFRNGSGRAWETLGVTYKSVDCISVYDAHARHTLEVSGNTMTQDNSYVYRRR